jgi:anti-sigma B factor antagonist
MKKIIRSEGGFTPAQVDRLRSETGAFLALLRIPGPQAYSIVTVVDEVGCNVLEHAKASFLELELRRGLGNVQLVFRDDGVPFDPTAKVREQAAALPGDSPERKLGLYMVASLGDALRYERLGSTNELSIVIPVEEPGREGEGLKIDSRPPMTGGPGQVWVLQLAGKLDVFSFVKLKSFLEGVAGEDAKAKLVLDLSNVEFVASSGWSVLLARRKINKLAGGELSICGMNADIDRVYKSMRITPLLPSFPDAATAAKALEAP